MSSRWEAALERLRGRVERTATAPLSGFPHFADPEEGSWTCSPAGDWTGGFWNGMLWLSAATTAHAPFRSWAQEWTRKLLPRVHSDTVFRGFLFYYGAALGDLLLGDPVGREVGLAGAQALAESFNPVAGVLPLGNEAEEASDVGRSEANVDTVQSSALLSWAARLLGDERLAQIARQHALRHIEFCLRPDGSVCQSASFDPATGALRRWYTHKGIRDDSTWGRAQAWGMVGWALAYQWEREARLLAAAEAAADWWIAHRPDDYVAFWDFDDPAIPHTNRDTSATAIAAASLLKLAGLTADRDRAARYRAEAEATVAALIEGYLTPDGRLLAGCYNKRIGLATNHELIWGSYYLYEALHVLAGALEPNRI
ncbi:MAG: glycoside hydrolase family 88 protein [Chloroflexi bacterium]|nr:glycoside hydrolase family 88 protein [Chloroflexota bacterium]